MKVKIEQILKLIKTYKREIEQSASIYIIEQTYYNEETEEFRKQLIIDFKLSKPAEPTEPKPKNHQKNPPKESLSYLR
jgi:hypothetical protein